MSKHLLACGLLLLCLTACKGRHADGTPTGETVEVEIEEVEAAEVQPVDSQGIQSIATDSVSEAHPATDTTTTAAPALTGRPQ